MPRESRPMDIRRYVAEVYPKDEAEIEDGIRRSAEWLGTLPNRGGSVVPDNEKGSRRVQVEVRSETVDGGDAAASEPMSIRRYNAEVYPANSNASFLRLNTMGERLRGLIARIDANTYERSFHDHDYAPIEPSGGTLGAPVEGDLIPLAEVPDEAFASGACGVGVGVRPRGNLLVAPCGCRVTAQLPSRNAIGLVTAEGIELLISVGACAQDYRGRAFRQLAWQNDTVAAGAPLIAWNPLELSCERYDATVSCIVTNPQEFRGIRVAEGGRIAAGEPMVTVEL